MTRGKCWVTCMRRCRSYILVLVFATLYGPATMARDANQLLQEANALGMDREELKISLLKEALLLDPSNVEAAKSLSFTRISQLFRIRSADDPQHPILTEAEAALDDVSTRTKMGQDTRNMVKAVLEPLSQP